MIVVTGASGLLGSNVALAACEQGRALCAVFHEHPVAFPGARALALDLGDSGAGEALVALAPRAIIHCAALANVDRCEEHPDAAVRANVAATRVVAEAARRAGAKLIYISTDQVFDGERGDYRESDAVRPLNRYAASKLDGERVALALNGALAVRTNIYGWNLQPKTSLAEWVLARLERGEDVPGFDDVFFCPLLVNDLAAALLALSESPESGVLHVAGGEAVSKYEFARAVAGEFGFDPARVRRESVERAALGAPRPKNMTLCTERAARVLGRPLPDVAAGLKRFRALATSGYVTRLKSCSQTRSNAS